MTSTSGELNADNIAMLSSVKGKDFNSNEYKDQKIETTDATLADFHAKTTTGLFKTIASSNKRTNAWISINNELDRSHCY
jgi:hypothetical protein